MKQIKATGKTIEEAIANGLAELGIDRDSVSVEVLENPKSGFLGIGATPAKVLLTVTEEDVLEELKEEIQETEEPKETVSEKETVLSSMPKEQIQKEEAPAAAEEKTETIQPESPVEESDQERAEKAANFVVGLLEKMNIEATVTASISGQDLRVDLSGENMGMVIGRRGETLDAIQHLTSYAVNRGQGKHLRVLIDTENYRARRDESLRGLARKTASKVAKYHRNMTLEPMNAYERHVIHEALQDWRDVTTSSVGVEPNRRVVIQYAPHHR